MNSRVRASPQQFLLLVEYMESHGDLARPLAGPQGRVRLEELWANLTNNLNAVQGGVTKTTKKWKKVWADFKSKTKKKALTLKRHASGTGDGPANRLTLSALEERVLAILGRLAVEGEASVEELGFYRPQSTVTSEVSLPELDLENFIEIPAEIPTFPGTLMAAPTPQEPPPAPPTPASLPSVTRRPRSTTTATSQSHISPRQPRTRARHRRVLTPFERAADEFAAVELRRLELEETRVRLQHEREIRALEVEHDRNQIFRSLVNVAQAWLDFCIRRENTE